ncbi:MAG: outer membrane lipoprotein [Acidiferrobacter sp.]
MKKLTILGMVIVTVAALTGCAMPPLNANTYRASESMQPRTVAFGTVLAVRAIQIRAGAQDGTTGAAAGGLGGAGVGAALGNTRGAVIGGVLGAVTGAFVGSQQTQSGEMVTIQAANGYTFALPQPMAKGEHPFFVNEKVEIIQGQRRDRVVPFN